jgi:hypothetical protein
MCSSDIALFTKATSAYLFRLIVYISHLTLCLMKACFRFINYKLHIKTNQSTPRIGQFDYIAHTSVLLPKHDAGNIGGARLELLTPDEETVGIDQGYVNWLHASSHEPSHAVLDPDARLFKPVSSWTGETYLSPACVRSTRMGDNLGCGP